MNEFSTHPDQMRAATTLDQVPLAPPAWRQLGVLVNDGSGSMKLNHALPDAGPEAAHLPPKTKAQAVDLAVRDLLSLMKTSTKAANFSFSFVTFHGAVSDERPPQELLQVPMNASYDPTANGTGGTAIWSGLEAAHRIVDDFVNAGDIDSVPRSAVVVVMSDGEDSDPSKTIAAAQRLRQLPNTSVAACFFATKGSSSPGVGLLQALASEPRLYQTIYTAEQLRDFFHSSITTTVLNATSVDGELL
jgi:uncharacterized protein YegL